MQVIWELYGRTSTLRHLQYVLCCWRGEGYVTDRVGSSLCSLRSCHSSQSKSSWWKWWSKWVPNFRQPTNQLKLAQVKTDTKIDESVYQLNSNGIHNEIWSYEQRRTLTVNLKRIRTCSAAGLKIWSSLLLSVRWLRSCNKNRTLSNLDLMYRNVSISLLVDLSSSIVWLALWLISDLLRMDLEYHRLTNLEY